MQTKGQRLMPDPIKFSSKYANSGTTRDARSYIILQQECKFRNYKGWQILYNPSASMQTQGQQGIPDPI